MPSNDSPIIGAQPIYKQVCEHFVGLIASGEWQPDKAIPSEIELARSLAVSQGTIRKAMACLERSGLINRQQGRGTFVADQQSDEAQAKYSNLRMGDGQRVSGIVDAYDVEVVRASEKERARLALQKGDEVYRCERTRTLNGHRFMAETLVIPKALFPQLETRLFSIPRTSFTAARLHGLLVGKAEERVDIVPADSIDAKSLDTTVGTPLLRLDRVIRTRAGQPIEWRVARCDLVEMYYMADFG